MTPTPKHIKEAQRLAAETESAIIAILSPEMGSNEIYAQILRHIPLATLLATQEELETLGPRVDKLFEAHKQWTLAVSDERDQLRAELGTALEEAVKENAELRTHNAALMTVARTATAFRGCHPRTIADNNLCNALDALEPLGIKV